MNDDEVDPRDYDEPVGYWSDKYDIVKARLTECEHQRGFEMWFVLVAGFFIGAALSGALVAIGLCR